jgi:PAS domain S-box-containing protein
MVQTLDTKSIAGYTLLKDYSGKPAFVLRVTVPRDASALGQSAVFYHILTVFGIGLFIAAAGLLVLQKQVVSRFAAILNRLTAITLTGDTARKIPVSGNDEISLMSRTINGMLAALEESSVEMRAREERYRLLAENAQDVIFTSDWNYDFVYLSPSISLLTGYTVEEAMEKGLVPMLVPGSADVAVNAFNDVDQVGSDTGQRPEMRTIELEIKRKDGSTGWVEANLNILQDAGSRPEQILGVLRDIGERKRAEIAMTNMYESEKKLRQELQEEISKRTEYTRALVHELKTPITPIMAAADLLVDGIKEPPYSNLVQSINRSAVNLNKRVDELLDLARSELNLLKIYPENTDLVELLRDIANDMTPVGAGKGLTVTADLPPSLPLIKIDKDRIKQVVLNLMNNAIKFTHSGGEIKLSTWREGDNLVVSVADTGPGISEQQQKGLFDPYRLVADDRQRLSGLGLGLTLSKQFVELHKGRLWVNSKAGKGSVFSFSMPLDTSQ